MRLILAWLAVACFVLQFLSVPLLRRPVSWWALGIAFYLAAQIA